MKKVFVLFLIMLAVGGWWIWCADSWRIGCLIAPFLLVMIGVAGAGMIEKDL